MAKDKRASLIAAALKYAKQGKIEAAIKEYEKVIQIKPDDLEIRRIIGDLQYNQKNLPEAVKQFDWIADFYRREGFHAKAIAMLKRVTKIDPTNEKVSFKLAELYSAQGLMIEAKQIYLDLAEEHKRKNDTKSALKMYEKILEFDSKNINMRLLLAENYLKEGMHDDAIREYLTVSDILIRKKEYQKIEELLTKVINKVKNEKLMEKLANCYIKQKKTDLAIDFLKSFGSDIYNYSSLLKLLGDLYFDKGMILEAEQIYLKVSQMNPDEVEIIMKLGRVYMNRKEFEKTYTLFSPVVDKYVSGKKFEDAISLLRFILTANDSYAPVREKMAEIFRLTDKKNSLIKILESLIPIYDAGNEREKLKGILQELIDISDAPFEYENKLKELSGEFVPEDNDEISADDEFMSHNFRKAEEAIQMSNLSEAEKVLKVMKQRFPGNLNISLKLFDLYELMNNRSQQIEEGHVLLSLYKSSGMDEDYSELLKKISALNPEDIATQNLVANERTDINIDFGKSEYIDEINDISPSNSDSFDMNQKLDNSDIIILTPEDSAIRPAEEIQEKAPQQSDSDIKFIDFEEPTKGGPDTKKSLSEMLKELKFYTMSKFFDEADKLVYELKMNYPGNDAVLKGIREYEAAKQSHISPAAAPDMNIPIPQNLPEQDDGGRTDEISLSDEPLNLDSGISGSESDSGLLIELDDSHYDVGAKINIEEEPKIEIPNDPPPSPPPAAPAPPAPPDMEMNLGPQPVGASEELGSEPAFELDMDIDDNAESGLNLGLDSAAISDAPIELSDPVAPEAPQEEIIELKPEPEAPSFEESGISSNFLSDVLDQEEAAPSPEPVPVQEPEPELIPEMESAAQPFADESPFSDDEDSNIFEDLGEDEDNLFEAEPVFLETESYFDLTEKAHQENEAILHWIKELERQRTSTIEKNMMEIFEEFKKGVEDKIGQEDYDTRYNLGIAYKEMGLLEEAIHEFLIASKHPLKLFDSAGLLGICFRTKGMYSESINWFKKALGIPDRKLDEYLNIKYELISCYELSDDLESATELVNEIIESDPNFRDIRTIKERLVGG